MCFKSNAHIHNVPLPCKRCVAKRFVVVINLVDSPSNRDIYVLVRARGNINTQINLLHTVLVCKQYIVCLNIFLKHCCNNKCE